MKIILIAVREKRCHKVTFLTIFRPNCIKGLCSEIWVNKIFLNCYWLIWAQSLGTQTIILASKILWIHHCAWLKNNQPRDIKLNGLYTTIRAEILSP